MSHSRQIPPAPRTRIYVRDKFTLKAGSGPTFLGAISKQIELASSGNIKLIAAGSEFPFDLSADTPEPPPPMMHVWEMPEWSTLYDAMFASSETPWFDRHQVSIIGEQQDLLVDLRLGLGVDPPRFLNPNETRVYMYDEIRMKDHRVTSQYLRTLNRFAAIAREDGWKWHWSASQITSQPQVACLLWSAPSVDAFTTTLAKYRRTQDHGVLMAQVAEVKRRFIYPTNVESLVSTRTEPTAAAYNQAVHPN